MRVEFLVDSLLVPRDPRVVPFPLLKTNISKIQIDLVGEDDRVTANVVFSCCEVFFFVVVVFFYSLLFIV